MRKSRETYYGDRETHECKFSRKRGFLPCKLIYRVTRETVPVQTSDMGKKTVSVLAHLFVLP